MTSTLAAARKSRKPVKARSYPVRRRRRWPWLVAVALVLALAGGAWYVLRFTPVLGLKQVTVQGVSSSLATSVRNSVNVVDGTPLIAVDVAAVAERVEAAVPEVETVRVVRHWPNGLVVVAVPRTAVAVTSANGSWWLLDRHGVPYLKVVTRPAGLLPVELATPGPGDPATLAAVGVVGTLPAGVSKLVKTVVAPSPYRISLSLLDGRMVIWGDASQVEAKAKALPVLLQQPGHTYDVSDPTLATVR